MVCVAVVSLYCAELLIRSVFKIPSSYLKQIVRFEPQLTPSKRLRPNLNSEYAGAFREFKFHVTTDSNGFRITEPRERNERLKPEIVVLGDSQTFGIGVNDDQTFSSYLSSVTGRSVLNTGCSGYNNYEELALARSIISYLKPKMLVLAFFAGNDPYENFQNRKLESPPKFQSPSKTSRVSLGTVKEWLSKNSAVYILLMRLRGLDAVNKLVCRLGLVKALPPEELEIFKKPVSQRAGEFWHATDPAILQLHELCRSQGIDLIVLFIPDRYQVETAYWLQWLRKYQLKAGDFDLNAPNKHVADLCALNGIHFMDPTSALRSLQTSEGQMYWHIDSHLAPRGHAVIAKSLAEYLTRIEPQSQSKGNV